MMPTQQDKRYRLLAYLLMVALGILGFLKLDAQQEIISKQAVAIEQSRVSASTRICTEIKKLTGVIKNLVNEAVKPEFDDSQEDLDRKKAYIFYTDQQLKPLECRKVVKPQLIKEQ